MHYIITVQCITITVQNRGVFLFPSTFTSYENTVERKKPTRYVVRTFNSLSSCGTFICLVCKCYSKLFQGLLSSALLHRLALTSLSVAHGNALRLHLERLCSKCGNILICTAMPVDFSLFFSKVMCMVQTFLHLSQSGEGLCHLPLVFGNSSSEVQTTCKSRCYHLAVTYVSQIQLRQPRPFFKINLLLITEHRVQLSTCQWHVGSFLLREQCTRSSAPASCSAPSTDAPVLLNHRNHSWGKSETMTFLHPHGRKRPGF